MLFRKKLPRSCSYCEYATKLDDSTVLCIKRGVVSCDSSCRKFYYDPTKRVPAKIKALDLEQYTEEDFKM